MDLRLNTDLTLEPLSVKDLAFFIKYEDSNENEKALIDNMIVAVRTLIERRTGLSFAKKVYECYFLKDDKPYILPVRPVVSVDTVELVDHLNKNEKIPLVYADGEYQKRGLYEVEIIPSKLANYMSLFVTFTVGYGESETESLPGDLLEAMKRQILQWYENRDDFRELELLGSVDKIINMYTLSI